MSDYRAVLTSRALRRLEVMPPRIVDPLLAFIFDGLARDAHRRGKPLRRDLEGYWSARRGDFRIIYRIDEQAAAIYVMNIDRRADVHRPG